jgi:hypothetical protein
MNRKTLLAIAVVWVKVCALSATEGFCAETAGKEPWQGRLADGTVITD